MVTTDRAVWIHGVSGRMGRLIRQTLDQAQGVFFAGGSDHNVYDRDHQRKGQATEAALAEALRNSDVVIDFSSVEANALLFKALARVPKEQKPAVLVATTGLSDQELSSWRAIKETQVLVAPNTSLGIMVMAQVTKQLAKILPDKNFDLEITETHHRHKVDAPSGTALFLARAAEDANRKLHHTSERSGKRKEMELGIHAVRGGNVFGEHEVRFLGDQEEIYLGHRAFSRELFAYGALTLAQWLLHQPVGSYSLFDVDLSAT